MKKGSIDRCYYSCAIWYNDWIYGFFKYDILFQKRDGELIRKFDLQNGNPSHNTFSDIECETIYEIVCTVDMNSCGIENRYMRIIWCDYYEIALRTIQPKLTLFGIA